MGPAPFFLIAREARVAEAERRALSAPGGEKRRVTRKVVRPMPGLSTPPLGLERAMKFGDQPHTSLARGICNFARPEREQPRELCGTLVVGLRFLDGSPHDAMTEGGRGDCDLGPGGNCPMTRGGGD